MLMKLQFKRSRSAHEADRVGQDGYTLIELVVTMSIAGVLASIAMFGFWTWQAGAQQRGSASQYMSQLRNASERAIAQGRTYCVDLAPDSRSYTVWQKNCGTGTQVAGPFTAQGVKVSFAVSATLPAGATCPSSHSCLYFYPRGTAVPGTVTVTSTARANVYTIHIEGLTSRVWM